MGGFEFGPLFVKQFLVSLSRFTILSLRKRESSCFTLIEPVHKISILIASVSREDSASGESAHTHQSLSYPHTGFQAGPSFPYFFVLLLFFPTFS